MISKHFETLKMVKFGRKKIVLPNETNLNIQFCLIFVLRALKKIVIFGIFIKHSIFATLK